MSHPEDDPRDDVQSWPCRKCNGRGRVIAQIHRLGLAPAGVNFLAAGCPEVRSADGTVLGREIVCPRCNGALSDPDPETPIDAELWAAINEYAAACGGDTGQATIGNRRMDAVAAVGRAVRNLVGDGP